jgi:hypothetical protein
MKSKNITVKELCALCARNQCLVLAIVALLATSFFTRSVLSYPERSSGICIQNTLFVYCQIMIRCVIFATKLAMRVLFTAVLCANSTSISNVLFHRAFMQLIRIKGIDLDAS